MNDITSLARARTPHTPQRVRERTAGLGKCGRTTTTDNLDTNRQPRQTFVAILSPERSTDHLGRDGAYRVKVLLKKLIRNHELRMNCIDVREVPAEHRTCTPDSNPSSNPRPAK
jgi:hypothetical protein